MIDQDYEPPVCEGCNKPILAGEPRYTGGEGADPPRWWHWDCHEVWLRGTMDALRRAPDMTRRARGLIDEVRRTLRGKT